MVGKDSSWVYIIVGEIVLWKEEKIKNNGLHGSKNEQRVKKYKIDK